MTKNKIELESRSLIGLLDGCRNTIDGLTPQDRAKKQQAAQPQCAFG
jgi:hypothetical protein